MTDKEHEAEQLTVGKQKPANVINLSDRIKDRDRKVETELQKRVIERWEGKP